MSEITDKYFTLKALADYSSMPVPTIRDYLRRDGLPHFKLRGKVAVFAYPVKYTHSGDTHTQKRWNTEYEQEKRTHVGI